MSPATNPQVLLDEQYEDKVSNKTTEVETMPLMDDGTSYYAKLPTPLQELTTCHLLSWIPRLYRQPLAMH